MGYDDPLYDVCMNLYVNLLIKFSRTFIFNTKLTQSYSVVVQKQKITKNADKVRFSNV